MSVRYYWFKKISDDGIEWWFRKKFASAFAADRWAMRKFLMWSAGKISFRIIFPC